jgi:hypothetical protein
LGLTICTLENLRDIFENWQSEFLQLIWQGTGLSFLWHVGSPQSKEEEERNQEMLQWIVKKLDPQKSEEFLKEREEKYPKNKYLTSLYNLDLIIIIHEIHSRVEY